MDVVLGTYRVGRGQGGQSGTFAGQNRTSWVKSTAALPGLRGITESTVPRLRVRMATSLYRFHAATGVAGGLLGTARTRPALYLPFQEHTVRRGGRTSIRVNVALAT